MIFILFILFLIMLRVGELILSRKNEKWLLEHGAVEYGREHYPFMIGIHTLFVISLIAEYYYKGEEYFSSVYFSIFLILVVVKSWIVFTLGKFWNTKIYRIPGYPLVKKGIYKYTNHPNYMIVVFEIAVIPLIFQLYYTAMVFSVLNILMLMVRIKKENEVLKMD